ncbi:MAG: hypothetical protein PT956_01620 [Firmicutes bacterium]|nr:hypothetical protein [Bacillota bacterium]
MKRLIAVIVIMIGIAFISCNHDKRQETVMIKNRPNLDSLYEYEREEKEKAERELKARADLKASIDKKNHPDLEMGRVQDETRKELIHEARKLKTIDLTDKSKDFVYATIFQLVMNPEDYFGRTFRLRGLYYSNHYEELNKDYHFVIVEDALACCQAGIEIVGDFASYPEQNKEVIIEGVFNKYTETDGIEHFALIDAKLID